MGCSSLKAKAPFLSPKALPLETAAFEKAGETFTQKIPAPGKESGAGKQKKKAGAYLSSQAVSSQVFSARPSLTSVFGMGTGGTSASSAPAILF